MAVKSVYLPEPRIEHDRIHITDDEHHHLSVARVEPNETIEIFDGKGNVWAAEVESTGKRETVVRVTQSRSVPHDSLEVILALAMIRVPAFELALEKLVEVGATRIVPFIAERSNTVPGNRHDRWIRILVEAAKQSKQYRLPTLDTPSKFDQVIAMPAASKIVFAERGGGPLKSALAGSPALCLIGPEGGWTDKELSAAQDRGFRSVSLGASILKAETAAIVGVSLVRYEFGK
jgi:16S rRNA (uracil1498-N3)-methyltransferase